MKKHALLTFFLLSIISGRAQEPTRDTLKRRTYIEIGGYHYKLSGGEPYRGYLLGVSWAGKKKRWSNDLYLCANSHSDFFVTNISENFNHLSYGKAFNLQSKHLFLKVSPNAGFFYRDYSGFNGYSYYYGIQFNPRIQGGFQTERMRFSLMANGNIGVGWFKYLLPDGTNPNEGKFAFPLNGVQYLAFSLNFAFSL